MKTDRTFQGAVVAAVTRLGPCTIVQVTAEVGRLITAAAAWREVNRRTAYEERRGRRCLVACSPQEKATQGRRWLTAIALADAARRGLLKRVKRGVYQETDHDNRRPASRD